MWNSPSRPDKSGKQYRLQEISALLYPLDRILDQTKSLPVSEVVEESILHQLDREEFVFALFQVFEAMLGDTEVPENGHTGIQEAIVAELLDQTHTQICCELDDPNFGCFARKEAWQSVEQLLVTESCPVPWILENAELVNLSVPQPFLSEKLTADTWGDLLLLSDGGLWDEFLWDADWRMDFLLDLSPDATHATIKMAGIDIDVVHALAHSPSPAEFRMAEHYLNYLVWKNEVALKS